MLQADRIAQAQVAAAVLMLQADQICTGAGSSSSSGRSTVSVGQGYCYQNMSAMHALLKQVPGRVLSAVAYLWDPGTRLWALARQLPNQRWPLHCCKTPPKVSNTNC